MPDLRTEQRLRQRYNFDVPVKFRVDAGGTWDETFRYVPNFVEFTSWCRRVDNVEGAGYKFESDATLRWPPRSRLRLVTTAGSCRTLSTLLS